MAKKRIDWIDVTKGIAIILMILGHTVPPTELKTFIFSFHMPLFIILSGITYKAPSDKSALKYNFIKYLKKLFLPYFISLLICVGILVFKDNGFLNFELFFKEFIKQFVWGNGCDGTFFGISFTGVGPLWFLITLFFSKIVFDYINFKLKNNKDERRNIVLYCFLLLLGFELGLRAWLPQGFDLMFIFLFYLYIGYLFSQKKLDKIINKNSTLVLMFVIWGICLGFNFFIELAMRTYPFGVLSIIESLCGSYLVIEGCRYISKNRILTNVFSKIGIISLNILCVHSIELVLIDWNNFGFNIYLVSICRVIFDIAIALIFTFIKNKIKGVSFRNKTV